MRIIGCMCFFVHAFGILRRWKYMHNGVQRTKTVARRIIDIHVRRKVVFLVLLFGYASVDLRAFVLQSKILE